MVTFKGIMYLLQSLFSQTMKVRAPSNQKILGAIEGPELPLLGMVISFYFLIIFYRTIYWDQLKIFILAIHWDFVLEFFYFAFLVFFLLGLLYLNLLLGLPYLNFLWKIFYWEFLWILFYWEFSYCGIYIGPIISTFF